MVSGVSTLSLSSMIHACASSLPRLRLAGPNGSPPPACRSRSSRSQADESAQKGAAGGLRPPDCPGQVARGRRAAARHRDFDRRYGRHHRRPPAGQAPRRTRRRPHAHAPVLRHPPRPYRHRPVPCGRKDGRSRGHERYVSSTQSRDRLLVSRFWRTCTTKPAPTRFRGWRRGSWPASRGCTLRGRAAGRPGVPSPGNAGAGASRHPPI